MIIKTLGRFMYSMPAVTFSRDLKTNLVQNTERPFTKQNYIITSRVE